MKTSWEPELEILLKESLSKTRAEALEELKIFIRAVVKEEKQDLTKFKDAAEMLWVVLANVSEGDWTKQPKEWQKAAKRWRDNYFKELADLERDSK